jgi:RNA polymerase sigma-70 factor (ECF subfamily)
MANHPGVGSDVADEGPLEPEATVELLERARRGDALALDLLLRRCLPPLRRWTHERVPPEARGMLETPDIVQETVMAALRRLDGFDARHHGALQAYLRQAVLSRVRELVTQLNRRSVQTSLPDQLVDPGTSPLEAAIGADNLARYEAALQRLRPADREAIVARIELRYSYEDLATALGAPTAGAARLAVTRAMKRLVDEMRHAV